MYINCHTYYSLRYGTIKPEQLLALALKNNISTLALTDINNTSACLDFVRLSEKYKIKPVLGVDFRNGAKQHFILLAKNNKGFQNINTYLSKHLHNSNLKTPKQAPQLNDTLVIYPYEHNKEYKSDQEHDYILPVISMEFYFYVKYEGRWIRFDKK